MHSRFGAAVLCAIVAFLPLGAIAQADPLSLRILQVRIDGSRTIDATGFGTVAVRAQLLDGDGKPFLRGSGVRALILRGDARLPAGLSSDLVTDEKSTVTMAISPGTQAGPLVVRFSVGDAAQDVEFTLTANVQAPLVVGYATGGIGPVPGWVEAPDGAPAGNTARRGAVSVFGTGAIANNTRGTFAYDSTDTLQQTLGADPFIDNPNNRPFPIYGDSSVRHDDALSTNHIFADVQSGRSSAMWGQFYAQAAPGTAVGGYNLLVNGAKAGFGGNVLGAGAFTARNNVAYARTVIAPTGLAVASEALHADIVIGSDILTLVHLDRRSGAILAQTVLGRGTDYEIDYADGLLRLLNIMLPYDDAFNPQVVVVQYEYGGPGATSTLLGGKGSALLTPATRADVWYLNDASGIGNLTLLGASLAGTTPGAAWTVSHERSDGFAPVATSQYGTGGDAYRATLTAHGGPLHVALTFAGTDAAYNNPYGNFTAPGLVTFDGTVGLMLSAISALDVRYRFSRNQLPASFTSQAVNNQDAQAAITLRVKPSKRLSYHVGIADDAASSNGNINPLALGADPSQSVITPGTGGVSGLLPAFSSVNYNAGSGSTFVAEAGIDWRFTPHATLGVSREQPLSAHSDPFEPPETQVQLGIDIGTHGTAFIRQLWQQSASESFAASQAGATYAATAESQTSIGIEERVGPTTYESGYAVQHTANGTDLFDAIGVRTKFLATKRFDADAFLQVGNSLYATFAAPAATPFFVAAGTSLDYTLPTFKAAGRVQMRTGFDAGSSFQLGATGTISPAVSLFGAYSGSFTPSIYNTEGRAGLSFRPSRNDRYVTLLSVDVVKSNLTNYDAYITNVAQLQQLYRSSTRTEWAASIAYKLTGDSFFAPSTRIYGVRGDQRIGSRFDIGSELHWSDIAPISGSSATGIAVEAGYRMGSSLRLAGGYNFSGFADPDTAINPTHRGAYVTLTTYIDRFFGWGKGDLP